MKKFLKWFGIILGIIVVGIAVTVFVLVTKLNNRMTKTYDIAVEKLTIPTDSASIAAGHHFVPLCQSCHGEALQGKVFFEDPKIGKIYSSNLTSGAGGIGQKYSDEDWIRALRHGVKPDKTATLIMPSKDFHHFPEKDLVQLIAYLKSMPPVDNEKGENVLPIFTKILMQLGAFGPVFSVEIIDHKAPFEPEIPQSESADYGKYLVTLIDCSTCHGKEYNGGKSPNPNAPPVPNLTPSGVLGKWTDVDFISTLRTGVTPEKKVLNDEFMPWKHLGQFSDGDLKAIFNFLKSLPAKETASE